jgi:chaperone modulatory protein CbpM
MSEYLTEDDVVAVTAGLTRDRLSGFVAARVVLPVDGDAGPLFRGIDIARLRLVCELSDDLGLDEAAVGIVLSLIDQLHGARSALRLILAALADESDPVRARVCAALIAADD